jgi:hypothetical protein
MAISKVEKELLVQGMGANTPSKGPYVQNMFWQNDCWKTRSGFAQIAQFDTKFGVPPEAPEATTGTEFGYDKHLGSYLIKTDFNHYQIISIFKAKIHTGSYASPTAVDSFDTGGFVNSWIASIYDVTAGTRFEQLLYRPTGDNNRDNIEMEMWTGQQETRLGVDREKTKSGTDAMVGFEEFDDSVFFGNPHMGLWYYKASKFMSDDARTGQSSGFIKQNSSCPWECYSESAVISLVVPTPGFYADGFAYLDEATFSSPQAIATFGNRLAYAIGREVYFSDGGNPNSIIATNQITIQSQELITGMAEISGSLLIWTPNETYLYQPNIGTLVNGGRITRLSENIGIISNNAFTKLDGRVIWVDVNGVYSCSGTFNIDTLSDKINQFFTDELSNPLSAYFMGLNAGVAGGAVGTGTPLPTTWYNLIGEPYVSLAYDASIDAIFISIPTKNMFLVLQEDNWHIWNFESVASDQDPAEYNWQSQNKVALSWVLAKDDKVFVVASVYDRTYSDEADYGGAQIDPTEPVLQSSTAKSYAILELGVGGSCDRSPIYFTQDLDVSSDTTQQSGYYKLAKNDPNTNTLDTTSEIVIGKPIIKPAGYVLPYDIADAETTVATETFLFPVYLKYDFQADAANTPFQSPTRQLNEPAIIQLYFQFDNNHWRPVTKNNLPLPPVSDNYIMLVFPTVRSSPLQMASYGLDRPQPTQEAQVYDSVTGLTEVEGNEIRIQGNFALTNFGGVPRRYNLLFYLPFTRKSNSPASELGIRHTGTQSNIYSVFPAPPANHNTAVYYYAYYDNKAERHGSRPFTELEFHSDPIEQPVDWVFKSGQVGLEETDQVRTRGIYSQLISRGNATNRISPATYFGQFNALLGSDYKEWCSQIIDMGDAFENPVAMATTFPPNIQAIIDGLAIRTRWWNSHPAAPPSFISYGVFGSDPTVNPLYGSNFDPDQGDFLLGDPALNTISMSDSVKGKYFTWMLFGHIRNWAEKIELYSVKTVLRPAGGRRRKGRSAGGGGT